MKSLAIKTVAVTIAVLAIPVALYHHTKSENEALFSDIDAIIYKECARQQKSGQEVSSGCLEYLR